MDSNEFNELLARLQVLAEEEMICLVTTDDGQEIICEVWQKKDTKEFSIFPILKVLTDEEKKQLKLLNKTPKIHSTKNLGRPDLSNIKGEKNE